jgi:hypothetical protein
MSRIRNTELFSQVSRLFSLNFESEFRINITFLLHPYLWSGLAHRSHRGEGFAAAAQAEDPAPQAGDHAGGLGGSGQGLRLPHEERAGGHQGSHPGPRQARRLLQGGQDNCQQGRIHFK